MLAFDNNQSRVFILVVSCCSFGVYLINGFNPSSNLLISKILNMCSQNSCDVSLFKDFGGDIGDELLVEFSLVFFSDCDDEWSSLIVG